ncbi:tRNA (N(6)-L-threonylcarbamoyladenosine(37)-C(2))-methylthiotransferase [Candidatus Micrarchaeota archaeon]|nr:tRNA (N(6)-L-threonylcarbamoyladenosine(37)-C(2))-methylthiotransferase [Candidatus Micrarchaeota archaeon]
MSVMETVWIETYGCTLNHGDSDIIEGILEEAGYRVLKDMGIPGGGGKSTNSSPLPDADIFILNTCAVKETTENKIIYRLSQLHGEGKKLVVAGCLGMGPNRKRVARACPNAPIIMPDALSSIVEAVECAKRGENKIFEGGENKGLLPRKYTAPILRIPAQDGCVGNCSFCQTKIARPRLSSRSPTTIKRWVEVGVEQGAREIQVTGQDTGAYGLDIGSGLPELLREMLEVEGDFRIRLGMVNPGHAKRFLPELLEIMEHPKFYRFLHVPVQTGSERVRESMNRAHSVKDFEEVVSAVREGFPDATISTDIIVGYPTETVEDFEQSKKLLERVEPDIVNISKFSSRRGTEASRMKKIDTAEIKGRSTEMSRLVHILGERRNSGYLGKTVDVLITEMQKTPTGRMGNYKQVCIDSDVKIGEWVKAKIIGYNHGSLFGEPV